MSETIDAIIERLGGAEHVAKLTGVGLEAIRKWRQARSIPAKHWPVLLRQGGLSVSDLNNAPDASPINSTRNSGTENKMPAADASTASTPPQGASAALVLADGTILWGRGFGANTTDGRIGEICFSTGMTGYQETLTDPSFAGQIITFTFPHIGNVGTNDQDDEAATIAARGLIVRQDITAPANWRATTDLDAWLRGRSIPGICGIDTRALTLHIRDHGPQSALIAFPADGQFDIPSLLSQVRAWPGLEGMDLAREVSCTQSYAWGESTWQWPDEETRPPLHQRKVVAVDYGAKRNILRCLTAAGCDVVVVPAAASADEILRHEPAGVFLSNGPGDPAATGVYAVPTIRALLDRGLPIFGICLGHQLLGLALGAHTYKLARGHRGANQPVKDLTTGRVEITSQNHGFAVDEASLPDDVRVTHTSLFDGSNEGIASTRLPAFSVQYHPEASPGPSDSFYLFERFVALIDRVTENDGPAISGYDHAMS